jgi:hypothetical protein
VSLVGLRIGLNIWLTNKIIFIDQDKIIKDMEKDLMYRWKRENRAVL